MAALKTILFMKKLLSYPIVLFGLELLSVPVRGADCLPVPILDISQEGKTQLWLEFAGEPGPNYRHHPAIHL